MCDSPAYSAVNSSDVGKVIDTCSAKSSRCRHRRQQGIGHFTTEAGEIEQFFDSTPRILL